MSGALVCCKSNFVLTFGPMFEQTAASFATSDVESSDYELFSLNSKASDW